MGSTSAKRRSTAIRQRNLRLEVLESRDLLNAAGLRAISTAPRLDQGAVASLSAVDFTFNKTVDPASLDTSDLKLLDFGTPQLAELVQQHGYYETRVANGLVYAATDLGLEILDLSDPLSPERLGVYPMTTARSLDVVGSVAYVVDGTALEIIDVSDASSPTHLARETSFTALPEAIDVAGNTAYVSTWDGLAIVDVTDPTTPHFIREHSLGGLIYEVKVVGNRAYAANGEGGLQIVDISNPAAPVTLGGYAMGGSGCDLEVVGNLVYLVGSNGADMNAYSLSILDVSNVSAPVRLGGAGLPLGEVYDNIQVVGNLAYLSPSSGGLQILDISDPAQPSLFLKYRATEWYDELEVVDDTVYVSDDEVGLQVIGISLPTNGVGHVVDNTYRFAFDGPLAGNHNFAFSLGPQIQDAEGGLMDQDQDGLLGEDNDFFYVPFTTANHAPTDIALSSCSMTENRPAGTTVGHFTTVDPDSPVGFTYTLVDGMGDTDNALFTISGGNLLTGVSFDYEEESAYSIRVRTTDAGGQWYERQFSISVLNLNEAPTAIVPEDELEVSENSLEDAVVGQLSTIDPDLGDTHAYTLVDDAEGRFAIEGNRLLVADDSLLNYEASTEHTIRIRTTDRNGQGLSYEQDLRVTVIDVNEAPTDVALTAVSVAESSVVGTVVGSFSSVDPDNGETFVYTLVDDADGRFKIVGDQLQVANGRLLDYETASSLTIRVRATDRHDASVEADFAITVTDVHDQASVGLFNPDASSFYLLGENVGGVADYTFGYGNPDAGWQTLVGDWDGNGATGVGLYAPESSTFYLADEYVSGYARYTFGYGAPDAGWIPLVGDWNGDGKAGVGFYDPHSSTFYLTDTLQGGYAEYTFGYGEPGAGWTPLVGDWDGNGACGVGLYNPHASTFYLVNSLTGGFAEHTFGYGVPDQGWQPMVGDWDGNGSVGVGLFDPHGSTFYLTSAFVTGFAQYTFGYGVPEGEWIPLVGDWNGDRAAGVGLYDPEASTFYLTNNLASGYAEYTVGFGSPGAGWQPLVGCWTVPTSADETPSEITTLNPTAVDQIDLGALAALELGRAA
jgi:hypothetical protein